MDHHPFNQLSCGMERLPALGPSQGLNQTRQGPAIGLPKIGHQPHGARRRRQQLLLKSCLLGLQLRQLRLQAITFSNPQARSAKRQETCGSRRRLIRGEWLFWDILEPQWEPESNLL
jgi:hypothetical protein